MAPPVLSALAALATALAAAVTGGLPGGGAQRAAVNLLLAASGMLAAGAGVAGLLGHGGAVVLPVGLPWLPMHLRLDPLAAFFLLVVGALLVPVALYSQGYLAREAKLGAMGVALPLFVLGMFGVVLADDAFAFMFFWELMSLASYFLVTFEHTRAENRRAGFLYLLMAHLAGLLILGAFAILYAAGGSFEFAAMRAATPSPFWASVAFLLAALGFGTKAGVVPMHGWLPDAHPVAPSNVSALMSGVMLKVALFGFVRVAWDLIGPADFQWWWGALVLAAGSSSAVFGVLFALQQHDLKRLLAYHSIENVGIILIGLGLSMLFAHFGHPRLAALGLAAALYHTINHALFKGLLFMGAGAVLTATGTREMEALGGLIRRMPATALFFLVASVLISALPPFNGFVSEWLTFQTALMSPQMGDTLLVAIVPFSAAMLALAGALAAACFVKVFGVVFLGHARSEPAAQAREVDGWMRLGMAVPAAACLLLGLLPVPFLTLLDAVPASLAGASLADALHAHGWLWLAPVSAARASYSAPIALAGMLGVGALAFVLLHRRRAAVRRGPVWSCGHPHMDARMQYTATSFSQPLRRIFAGLLQPEEHAHLERPAHRLLTRRVRHAVHVGDPIVRRLYHPIAAAVDAAARRVQREHQRGLHAYLAWAFAVILLLLVVLA